MIDSVLVARDAFTHLALLGGGPREEWNENPNALVERVPDTPDPASDPADVITRGELVATTQVVVRAALAQLPPDQRRVIYARY
jgi:DNA-directed RNA polymerase specialized sigma24 family protein